MLLLVVARVGLCRADQDSTPGQWKAGVFEANTTPIRLLRMGGSASRTEPAKGTLTDLWAKALVLEDANGAKVVLIAALAPFPATGLPE